jgi:hypothetical protein
MAAVGSVVSRFRRVGVHFLIAVVLVACEGWLTGGRVALLPGSGVGSGGSGGGGGGGGGARGLPSALSEDTRGRTKASWEGVAAEWGGGCAATATGSGSDRRTHEWEERGCAGVRWSLAPAVPLSRSLSRALSASSASTPVTSSSTMTTSDVSVTAAHTQPRHTHGVSDDSSGDGSRCETRLRWV